MASSRLTARSATGRTAEVGRSFELWTWLFMRVSGVVLLFLALGHLAIQHVFNDVGKLDFDFVARQWSSVFWRTWDWLLLVLSVLHGSKGVRTLICDYVRSPARRLVLGSALAMVAAVTALFGTMVIVTFRAP